MKSSTSYAFPPLGWVTFAICDYVFVLLCSPWRQSPVQFGYCLHVALITVYNFCMAMALWCQIAAMTQDPGHVDYNYSEYDESKFSPTVAAIINFLKSEKVNKELTIPITNQETFIQVEQQVLLLESDAKARQQIESFMGKELFCVADTEVADSEYLEEEDSSSSSHPAATSRSRSATMKASTKQLSKHTLTTARDRLENSFYFDSDQTQLAKSKPHQHLNNKVILTLQEEPFEKQASQTQRNLGAILVHDNLKLEILPSQTATGSKAVESSINDSGFLNVDDTTVLEYSVRITREEAQFLQTRLQAKCLKCCGVKPPRTHHCSVCKKCVMRMDHHCPWICNCIGVGNQKAFLQFVLWVFLLSQLHLAVLGWTGVFCRQAEQCVYKSVFDTGMRKILLAYSVIAAVGFGFFAFVMLAGQLNLIRRNTSTIDSHTIKENVHQKLQKKINQRDFGFGSRLKDIMGSSLLFWLIPLRNPQSLPRAPEHEVNQFYL